MGAQKALAENTKPYYKTRNESAKFVRFFKAEGGRWQYPPNCTSVSAARTEIEYPKFGPHQVLRDVQIFACTARRSLVATARTFLEIPSG